MRRFTNYKPQTTNSRAFTLVEILLVVAIIAILAAIVIIAVNPARQLAQTRNAQRRVDVNTILNAVYQRAIDNGGVIDTNITTNPTEICGTGTGGVASTTCAAYANLYRLTDNETYLVSIPVDPSGATTSATSTGYQIFKSSNGRVTVRAPGAEESVTISITR